MALKVESGVSRAQIASQAVGVAEGIGRSVATAARMGTVTVEGGDMYAGEQVEGRKSGRRAIGKGERERERERERDFPKGVKREARNCQQLGVKKAQRPRGTVWMKKVRNIRWHTVLIDTLKTETSNFVLDPSLHWKSMECSEQCCYTCNPGLMEDKSGYMILYALKLIQFVVRDTSKKRITVV